MYVKYINRVITYSLLLGPVEETLITIKKKYKQL